LDQACYVGGGVSVTLFGQKLLDCLPIILCKPRVCDQFNNLHKESVPVLSAYTPHSNFEDFLCSQFVLGVLPVLARHEDSWAANHAFCVLKNHLHCTALSRPAQFLLGPAAPVTVMRLGICSLQCAPQAVIRRLNAQLQHVPDRILLDIWNGGKRFIDARLFTIRMIVTPNRLYALNTLMRRLASSWLICEP
jgi:hypothetical protein